MAGEDFLPVGVRAIVQNVDDFVADMARMERAVASLGNSIRESGTDIAAFGTAATRAESQAQGFDSMLLRMRQHEDIFSESTKNLAQTILNLANSLRGQEPAMNRFTVSLQQAKQAGEQGRLGIIKHISSLDIFRNKIEQLRIARERERASLASNTAAYKQAQQVVQRLTTTRSNLEARLKNERSIRGRLNQSLFQASKAYKKARADLVALNNEIKKHQQFGMSAEQQAKRFYAQELRLGDAFKKAMGDVDNLSGALDRNQSRMNRIQAAIGATNTRLTTASGGAARFSAAMGLAGASANRMTLGIGALSAGLGLITIGATAAGVAISLLKAAFTLLRKSIQAVGKALLLVNSLFIGFVGVIKRLNGGVQRAAKLMFRWGNSIRFLGTSISFLISLPIIGFLGGLTKSAIDFEEAFAGVIKTVDSADFRLIKEGSADVKDLTKPGRLLQKRIRDLALEIPIAATELAKLGEVAGTLSVRGVDNLTTFIDTVAKLGVTTDVTAEDAAKSFAKVIGISGGLSDAELGIRGLTESEIENLTNAERFQLSVESLGGVLVDLGNKTRAVESTILDMSKQMAATSDVVGVTTAQMFGIAGAFDATGATAVRAKTTYQRVMFDMLRATQEGGLELEIFAKTAGETTESFVELFQKDAAMAFLQFTEGLGAQGDEAVRTLEELDLADNRVMQTVLSLANAEGELRNQLRLSNEEIEAQADGLNALETEAQKRFSTTQSQLILLKNQFVELGIVIGSIVLPELNKLIGFVRGLIERLSELNPNILKTIITVLLLVAAFGPLVTAIGLGMATFGFIIGTITTFIGAILSVITTLGLLALPIFAVIGALVGLGIAFIAAFKKIDRFADFSAKTLVPILFEFGKNIILAFARGMAKALMAIVIVLNAIGEIISKWLKPGSPPKLLPDLDDWGENAMLIYMEGWASADFGIFNKIADKIEGFMRSIGKDVMPEEGLINRILGTRKEIANVLKQIKKVGKVTSAMLDRIERAMGGTSQRARDYVRALLDVAAATEEVKRAQEELAQITKKYDAALKPISDRLKQISERQQEVADAMRVAELEAVLADPRATELVRELAQLELEQIGLEADTRSLESARDIELERAQAKLEAAETEKEAAEETLAVAEAMLDIQTKNNQLVNEMIQAIEKLGSKLDDLSIGDIAAGFDPDAIEVPTAEDLGELLDFSELEGSVNEAIGSINTEFSELVTELKEIFAPLGPLWDELGTTWAPIIERLLLFFEDIIPAGENAATTIADWQVKVESFAEKIANLLVGTLFEFFAILVDLGLIDPFGPLVAHAEQTEGPLSRIGQTVANIRQFFRDLWQSIQDAITAFTDLGLVHFLIESLHAILEGLEGPVSTLVDGFKSFWGSLGRVVDTIKEAIDKAEGLKAGIKAIVRVVVFVGTVLSSILRGIIVGIVGAITKAVGYVLPFLGLIFEGVANIVGGIIEIVSAAFEFVMAIIEGLRGNSEKAGELMATAWQNLKDGIINILEGLLQAVIGIFGALIGAVFGLVAGFVEGIVNFFKDLWDRLVGRSIVTDIIEGILGLFEYLFIELPLKVAGFVLGLIQQFADLALQVLTAIGEFVLGIVDFFVTLATDVLEAIGQFIIDAVVFFVELPFKILEALANLPEDIGGVVGDILQWFIDLPGEILDALSGMATMLFDVGKDMVQGLIDGVSGLAGDAVDSVVGVGEDILDGIGGFFGISSPSKEMEDIGEDVMAGWIEGVEGQAKALLNIFTDMAEEVVEIVVDALTIMVRIWADITASILPVTHNWGRTLVEMFTDVSRMIALDGASSIMGMLVKTILQFVELLYEDALVWFEEFLEAFVTFFDLLIQAFVVLKPAFRRVGESLMDGLRAGLEAGAQAVYDTARTIAREVERIVNDANEIESPSKVFVEIGKQIIGGWAIGMEQESSRLFRTVAGIAGELAGQAQPANLPQLSQQQAVAPVMPAGSVSNVTQAEINMGGQNIQSGVDIVMLQIALEQALRNVLE
jgi:TP901 family phage tail tape measure protein